MGKIRNPRRGVIKSSFMSVSLPSFAKINLGLRIGPVREDGFHELRTVYQTIALHDTICVSVTRGSGIEIKSDDRRVPLDATNTCYRVVERAVDALRARGRVRVEIEKRLPVQGGLGGASGNAVSALLGLERALGQALSAADRLRIVAEVGSDLPLFLIGGTVLGVGHGEEVYPLPELPAMPCVIALPEIAVSTPKAFSDWDRWAGADGAAREPSPSADSRATKLKNPGPSDTMTKFSREISAWLSAEPELVRPRRSGVSAGGGGRAENPLLDLVRTGIENDFERVVFPEHPELREVKSVLQCAGARYASLSGSGSTLYGMFESAGEAEAAAAGMRAAGHAAAATRTLGRTEYWKQLAASN